MHLHHLMVQQELLFVSSVRKNFHLVNLSFTRKLRLHLVLVLHLFTILRNPLLLALNFIGFNPLHLILLLLDLSLLVFAYTLFMLSNDFLWNC